MLTLDVNNKPIRSHLFSQHQQTTHTRPTIPARGYRRTHCQHRGIRQWQEYSRLILSSPSSGRARAGKESTSSRLSTVGIHRRGLDLWARTRKRSMATRWKLSQLLPLPLLALESTNATARQATLRVHLHSTSRPSKEPTFPPSTSETILRQVRSSEFLLARPLPSPPPSTARSLPSHHLQRIRRRNRTTLLPYQEESD